MVREGSGEFYAMQGDDKCALGAGTGSVLVSRFDVQAVLEDPKEH